MRSFSTQGCVYPEENYVVPRTVEVADFIRRVKAGKYIVLFAPRQTGKTTFFRLALSALTAEEPSYFPIELDFQDLCVCSHLTRFTRSFSTGFGPANCGGLSKTRWHAFRSSNAVFGQHNANRPSFYDEVL